MSRLTAFALLCVPGVLVAAPVPKAIKAKGYVGEWRVEFVNGVVETCSVDTDGKAAMEEPLRKASGVVLTFEDDRTERWTPDGDGYLVEHWYPSSSFPAGIPVRGVAARQSPLPERNR